MYTEKNFSSQAKKKPEWVTFRLFLTMKTKYYFLAKKSFTFADSTTASLKV